MEYFLNGPHDVQCFPKGIKLYMSKGVPYNLNMVESA